jgi:hypothetical protein
MKRIILALCVLLAPRIALAESASGVEVTVDGEHDSSRNVIQQRADLLLSKLRKDSAEIATARPKDRIKIAVTIRAHAAKGSSRYRIDADGRPQVVQIELVGDINGILSDELPRQLTQIVLAEQIGVPPRWAEMGVGLLAESPREQNRNWQIFRELRDSGAMISAKKLLEYTQYASESEELNTMYVQSMAFTDFIVSTWGREKFVAFLADSKILGVPLAIREHFDFDNVGEFDLAFRQWAAAR